MNKAPHTETKPIRKHQIRRKSNPLVGAYFHSLNPETSKIQWQGWIVGSPEPGWYLVEVFEWLAGNPNGLKLVKIQDMEKWLFYRDAEEMRFSYEHGQARAGGPYRDQ